MIDENELDATIEYAFRFGQIAIRKGFITDQQMEDALDDQIAHGLNDMQHKLIGDILLEKKWMTQDQIEIVLEELARKKIRVPGSPDTRFALPEDLF